MSGSEVLGALRARWRAIVLGLVIGLALLCTHAAFQTPLYQSNAQLLVSGARDDSAVAYQGSAYTAQRVKSYAALAESSDVAKKVIDRLKLDTTPGALTSRVVVTVPADTVVLQLGVQDPSPAQAQRIATAYADVVSASIEDVETPEGQTTPLVKAAVINSADLPTAPVSPRWVSTVLLGLFLGTLLGLLLALLRHLTDNRLRDPDEVAAIGGAPVLALLPRLSGESAATDAMTSEQREAMRLLRTNLVFADTGKERRSYVVTSSVAGEGKSTVALDLARTIALAGRSVLLIDADLRKPMLSGRLGIDREVGLTSVLVGSVSFEDAVQSTTQHGLTVLASGAIPPNPAELLQTDEMTAVLAAANRDYDVTIIDSAPLLPVSDTVALAAVVDGVVLLVRHRRTTRRQLREALNRLTNVRAKLLGLAVNAVPARMGGYGYSYVYGPYGADEATEAEMIGATPGASATGGANPDASAASAEHTGDAADAAADEQSGDRAGEVANGTSLANGARSNGAPTVRVAVGPAPSRPPKGPGPGSS